MDEFLTIRDVANYLGARPDTIRRLCKEGTLRGVRLGGQRGHWRIHRSSLKRLIGQSLEPRQTERLDGILTTREVASYLKTCLGTIYHLRRTGRLPAFKIGERWHIHRSDLQRFVGQNPEPVEETDEILSISEVANYLRVHPDAVRCSCKERKLRAFKIGGRWRIHRSDLQRFVGQNPEPVEETDEILSISEVANYLRAHPDAVRCLCKERKLRAFKIGRRWRIHRSNLQRFVGQNPEPVEETDEILSISEVANYLRVHPDAVRCLCKERKLRAFKIGGRWRVHRSNLQRFVGQNPEPVEETDEILSISEVANYLRVHPDAVRCLCKERKLRAFKIGGRWRVHRSDLKRFVEQEEIALSQERRFGRSPLPGPASWPRRARGDGGWSGCPPTVWPAPAREGGLNEYGDGSGTLVSPRAQEVMSLPAAPS